MHCHHASRPVPDTLPVPRTPQPLLRARPPKFASATSSDSSSPTGRTGNARFTAPRLRLSPEGTGSAVLAVEGAVRAPPGRAIWGRPTRRLPKRIRSEFDSSELGGGWIPQPAFRPAANGWLPLRALSPQWTRSPSSPGTLWQAALIDHARAAGWVRALARGILARWLAISRRGWPQTGFTTPSMSWPWPSRPAALAGSPAFPLWSRPDPTFKPRLSGFLSTPQGTRRVTVLLGDTVRHTASSALAWL